jgi:hypothetical protein
MVTGLLDTSVLVDVLRGYQPAEDWLATQAPSPDPLPPVAGRTRWLVRVRG